MTHIEAPQNCMGCALCANVCPKDAITMKWSRDGFPVPSIDEERCIECGRCVKACIAREKPAVPFDDLGSVDSYGAWHREHNLHHRSSSGGVFSALAEYVLAKGGCVFGVVWQDRETAAFCKAENREELAAMRGSKYTPALPGYAYREARAELKKGRYVLFSGTPCQVHALKTFLNQDYPNLLTMDIVCHGTPSRLILQKYIKEDEVTSGKPIEHVSFREKTEGWLDYNVMRHYADGTCASTHKDKDTFMHMFLCNGALNYACYNCPYAHLPRQGDISVGDYWGVQHHHPEWPLHLGVSAVLVHSERGRQVLAELQSGNLELKQEPFRNIECKQLK